MNSQKQNLHGLLMAIQLFSPHGMRKEEIFIKFRSQEKIKQLRNLQKNRACIKILFSILQVIKLFSFAAKRRCIRILTRRCTTEVKMNFAGYHRREVILQ